MKNICLASTSSRRISILTELLEPSNIQFQIVKPYYEEVEDGFRPEELVVINAEGKVNSAKNNANDKALIISADTIVAVGSEIIGKPGSENEARISLKKLSDRSHSVFTGIAVLDAFSNEIFKGYEETVVTFYKLTDKDIEQYISTSEPFDKAGAYGIQGFGEIFVKNIKGSYSNVVGLPKRLTWNLLNKADIVKS